MDKHGSQAYRRIIGFVLAFLFFFTHTSTVYALETPHMSHDNQQESRDIIVLRTASDLQELSANSTTDVYSRNREFRLANDINLNGVEFLPVSIFAGIFDGNGHAITGLQMTQSGEDQGFFRFIEADGVIRNLTISGEIRPDGLMQRIGGIAGTNRGTIENCVFQGSMLTKQISGGIVGHNEESGEIVNCTNQGEIVGIKQIGGIVGRNEGTVWECVNSGNVNATAKTAHDLLGEDFALSISLDGALLRDNMIDENKITFIGGIAGTSSGTMESCVNRGTVGYQHMGYQVGGVVGYQQGYLADCRNNGAVFGRRDVGGIAGLLEPYMEVVYEADASSKLRTQSDNMALLMDELYDITDRTSEQNSSRANAVWDAGKELTDTVADSANYYRDQGRAFHNEVESRLDSIEDTLEDMGFDSKVSDFVAPVRAIRNDLARIKELLEKPRRPVLGMSGGQEQLGEYIELMKKTLEEIKQCKEDIGRQVDTMLRVADRMGSDVDGLNDDLDRLERKLKNLQRYVSGSVGRLWDDLDDTGTAISNNRDALDKQMESLKDDLSRTRDDVSNQLKRIEGQLRIMGDTLADSLDELKDQFDFDLEGDGWYVDISDIEDPEAVKGMLVRCVNNGEIFADNNGGGIAGSMAVDRNLESEFSIEKIGESSINRGYYARATIWGCENGAAVTVKNNCAGGVVGRSDLGAVLHSNNYGYVQSTDGDYAGGIAGKSKFLIRNCYVLCEVVGNRYVGGIGGFGKDVDNNIAMVGILSQSGEKYGSIMGDVEQDAAVFNNYYVNDQVAAINNLTYEQAAKCIDYTSLLEMGGTPDRFRSFTVQFISDGKLVKSIPCAYGQSIDSTQIPAVPEHNGKVGVWEEKDLSFVDRNIVLHAVYDDWLTTISSGEQIPVALAGGLFYHDTTLQCVSISLDAVPAVKRFRPVAAYSVVVDSQYGVPKEEITIRLLADGKKRCMVLLWSDNGQRIAWAERDGGYLVFHGGIDESYAILKKAPPPAWIFIVAGVATLLIAAGALVLRRHKHKTSK